MSIDQFDARLLRALQADGRLTNQQLADRVGLSASQCSRRRAALETERVIRGYRADLDAAKLGQPLLVFVQVTLATHSRDNAKRFRDLVAAVPAIQECYAMTGDADYLLKVRLPGLPDLAALVNDVLLPHESVSHVRSSIVFDTLKHTDALPIAG
ncbi:MAG TPA: Lrp/AsnC family transcriptional regulator [Acetobacteraceae bacterium]|nr:Lrp/AsnC family transcriptional regulator [Acetobacteraceae bacterium]